MTRRYQVCTRCVMDTSDPEITFDGNGQCNHCRRAEELIATRLPAYKHGEYALDRIVPRIQQDGRGKPYDCIVGVSGGADSTYAAYLCKKVGLRPLAVHFDNGWNSELAVKNIEQTLSRLGVELYTHVVNWNEFRRLQLSFLRASVPDAEVPTDHGIWALLYRTAAKFKARYIISGTNIATESILPQRWTYGITDWRYISGIHRRFERGPLATYPHVALPQFAKHLLLDKIKTVSLLNAIDYNKAAIVRELEAEIGWRNYGGKHHESIYTRFFQSYILPRKFGIDKRKAHLSSLIVSGQLSRDAALAELKEPIADPDLVARDLDYVVKKLEVTREEFDGIMAAQPKSFHDYPNDYARLERAKRLMQVAQRHGLLPRQVGM